MLNFQAKFILGVTSMTLEAFKGFAMLWLTTYEKLSLLPQTPTSCCGIGDVARVKRAGMVGRFAKCLVELELVNGPGVISKEKAGRRKAHILLVVCQENPKSLDFGRLHSISSLSCLE